MNRPLVEHNQNFDLDDLQIIIALTKMGIDKVKLTTEIDDDPFISVVLNTTFDEINHLAGTQLTPKRIWKTIEKAAQMPFNNSNRTSPWIIWKGKYTFADKNLEICLGTEYLNSLMNGHIGIVF